MKNLIFNEFEISNDTKKAIRDMGFEEATQIQSKSIPVILQGKDIIGQAQTGTGKTCAFGVPAIEMIDTDLECVQVLILCPTRELAIQSSVEMKNLSKYKKDVKVLPIYGGQPIDKQIKAMKKRPQIIIGTPGRIIDHIRRRTLKLENLNMIVLDEADEMLNMGFREDIDIILEKVPDERQTILFSATMPDEIIDITSKYQKDPVKIKVFHEEITVSNIEQFYLEVSNNSKLEILSRLIDTNNLKLSLIFCNTKKRAEELAINLQARGYSAESLHGDMRQEQRDRVMEGYRKCKFDILTATDVAARGIDVDDIDAVFNYDIPNDDEYYVHRIGRTGRAGREGKAFTFVVGRDILRLRSIQKYTKSIIKKIKHPKLIDIEEFKINSIVENIKSYVLDNNLNKHIKYVEEIIEDINSRNGNKDIISSIEIAAALLKLQNENETNHYESILEDNENEEEQNDMVKLFINIGRNNKINPKNIIESIVKVTNMPGKLIGAIKIYDNYTFVDVPKCYSHNVLSLLKNQVIKGKKINVEKSYAKKFVRKKKSNVK